MTTNQGLVIADDQNTLTVGPRGPQLLEDFIMPVFFIQDALKFPDLIHAAKRHRIWDREPQLRSL